MCKYISVDFCEITSFYVFLLFITTLVLLTPLPSGNDHADVIPVQQNAFQRPRRFFPGFLVSIEFDGVFEDAIHVHVEAFQDAGELFVSALHYYPDFFVHALVHQLGREENRRVRRRRLFRRECHLSLCLLVSPKSSRCSVTATTKRGFDSLYGVLINGNPEGSFFSFQFRVGFETLNFKEWKKEVLLLKVLLLLHIICYCKASVV